MRALALNGSVALLLLSAALHCAAVEAGGCGSAAKNCSWPLYHTDFTFGDVNIIASIMSFEDCCDACTANPKCNLFTWNVDNKKCILKGEVVNVDDHRGMAISGLSRTGQCTVPIPGWQFNECDISSAAADSYDHCCAQCATIQGCSAVTFYSGNNTCVYKHWGSWSSISTCTDCSSGGRFIPG